MVGGRSARELGIEWLHFRCELSPSKAHYLQGKDYINGGRIFECKFCHKVTWLPTEYSECQQLGAWLRIYGQDAGYQRMLDLHPAARTLLAKIQDIYYLKKCVPADILPKVLACVMTDQAYPYEVELVEEEML